MPRASYTTPTRARSSVTPKTRTSPSPWVRNSTLCGPSTTSTSLNAELHEAPVAGGDATVDLPARPEEATHRRRVVERAPRERSLCACVLQIIVVFFGGGPNDRGRLRLADGLRAIAHRGGLTAREE